MAGGAKKTAGNSSDALNGSIKRLDDEISAVLDGPKDSAGSASPVKPAFFIQWQQLLPVQFYRLVLSCINS